jgi:hypothetical protein
MPHHNCSTPAAAGTACTSLLLRSLHPSAAPEIAHLWRLAGVHQACSSASQYIGVTQHQYIGVTQHQYIGVTQHQCRLC